MTSLVGGAEAACIEREPGAIRDSWSALASRRVPPSIFLTPEWIAVARAHDRATPITLAVGTPPCAVAALAREADGTVRFAGGELTDVQDLVAAPGFERLAAESLAAWLAAERPPRISFEYVPEGSGSLDAVAPALARAGYRVARERQVPAPFIALPDDFEAYVRSLGKKERHELRRKLRRLGTTARASFRTAQGGERAAVLDRFFALHRLSRGRKADFMTPVHERFFRDVADALAPLGRLRLGVVSVDGTDAAVLFAFAYEGTLALYNAAYDPGLAWLSVGVASHAWQIREAIADGFREYDLLRGDEPYKYDLGARDRWLERLEAVRA